MVFDYFSFARARKNTEELEKTNPQNPVLKDEDEQFLQKIASHDIPEAPLPPATLVQDTSDKAAQNEQSEEASTEKPADTVALPKPTNDEATQLRAEPSTSPKKSSKAKASDSKASSVAEPTAAQPEVDQSADEKANEASTESTTTALDQTATAYPPGVTVAENVKLDQAKIDEDHKEVSVLLDRLNLSSINNRVFSFSKESEKLYEEFTVVLKDMINGAPTAYQDMEKLLKDNDAQLRTMFKNMPPFVQTLVKSLPAKLGGTLGPEILAATSNKPGADMKSRMQAASQPSTSGPAVKKQKSQVPSIKGLANEKGAVAGMLRSIVTFLKARFPAFVTGTNVIMSIAVFVLLFVFYYCHKRGRETRLQREADAASITEASDAESGLDESEILTPDSEEEKKEIGGEDAEEADTKDVEGVEDVEPVEQKQDAPIKLTDREQDLLDPAKDEATTATAA
ncbi:hypothetical protein ANO11243_004640 [Dothideomycetidae sp. 11243]|nr:hypothetical protein ANO11243_004640 [fungal sp. No.11243]